MQSAITNRRLFVHTLLEGYADPREVDEMIEGDCGTGTGGFQGSNTCAKGDGKQFRARKAAKGKKPGPKPKKKSTKKKKTTRKKATKKKASPKKKATQKVQSKKPRHSPAQAASAVGAASKSLDRSEKSISDANRRGDFKEVSEEVAWISSRMDKAFRKHEGSHKALAAKEGVPASKDPDRVKTNIVKKRLKDAGVDVKKYSKSLIDKINDPGVGSELSLAGLGAIHTAQELRGMAHKFDLAKDEVAGLGKQRILNKMKQGAKRKAKDSSPEGRRRGTDPMQFASRPSLGAAIDINNLTDRFSGITNSLRSKKEFRKQARQVVGEVDDIVDNLSHKEFMRFKDTSAINEPTLTRTALKKKLVRKIVGPSVAEKATGGLRKILGLESSDPRIVAARARILRSNDNPIAVIESVSRAIDYGTNEDAAWAVAGLSLLESRPLSSGSVLMESLELDARYRMWRALN